MYVLFMAAAYLKSEEKLSLIMKKLVYWGLRPGCTQTQASSVTYSTKPNWYVCLS